MGFLLVIAFFSLKWGSLLIDKDQSSVDAIWRELSLHQSSVHKCAISRPVFSNLYTEFQVLKQSTRLVQEVSLPAVIYHLFDNGPKTHKGIPWVVTSLPLPPTFLNEEDHEKYCSGAGPPRTRQRPTGNFPCPWKTRKISYSYALRWW